MSIDTLTIPPSPQPSPGVPFAALEGRPGEGASERISANGTLTLLREWQTVCDAIARGETSLLIRKGGIAEGRAGFELKKSFFGLLPTLFHQVKHVDSSAETPAPPTVVMLLCQVVAAYAVPSATDLSSLAAFHAYAPDQLAARQTYKPERPLNLLVIRPFRLRQPIELSAGAVKASCKSWVEAPLERPMGGIEAVGEPPSGEATLAELRRLVEALPSAGRIS